MLMMLLVPAGCLTGSNYQWLYHDSIWARKWLIRAWIKGYTMLFQNRYKTFRAV